MPKRRTFTAEFKSQLVLKVISGEQSAAELCRQHQIKPQLLSDWKATFLANAATVFQSDGRLLEAELRIAEMERQIATLSRRKAALGPTYSKIKRATGLFKSEIAGRALIKRHCDINP